MNLSDYNSTVQHFVFEKWIDIPFSFEYMVEIIAVQFFNNGIAVKEACDFAQLVIDIQTKGEFDYDFEYEPFQVLENELSEDFVYDYDSKVNFESFEIILDGEKRIDINYQEGLTFDELVSKINQSDEPIV